MIEIDISKEIKEICAKAGFETKQVYSIFFTPDCVSFNCYALTDGKPYIDEEGNVVMFVETIKAIT